jgi:hypothetical protein
VTIIAEVLGANTGVGVLKKEWRSIALPVEEYGKPYAHSCCKLCGGPVKQAANLLIRCLSEIHVKSSD